MNEKLKACFIMAVFAIVLIAGTSYLIDIILIKGLTVDTGIISGLLGMVGGFSGAMGAFLVARHQIKKEAELHERRDKELSRPIISCMDFIGTMKLSNAKLKEKVRIMDTPFYQTYLNEKEKYEDQMIFLELKILGEASLIYDAEATLFMSKKYYPTSLQQINVYVGLMERDIEIYIPMPLALVEEGYMRELTRLELFFETQKGEKMKYIYDIEGKKEEYYLLNDSEVLLKTINMKESAWIYPAKRQETK